MYNDHSVYVWDVREVDAAVQVHAALFHAGCIWDLEVNAQALCFFFCEDLVPCSLRCAWLVESNLGNYCPLVNEAELASMLNVLYVVFLRFFLKAFFWLVRISASAISIFDSFAV